ncbi:hypothetical protein ACFL2V_09360 [Pseudomonadota bacterium]
MNRSRTFTADEAYSKVEEALAGHIVPLERASFQDEMTSDEVYEVFREISTAFSLIVPLDREFFDQ